MCHIQTAIVSKGPLIVLFVTGGDTPRFPAGLAGSIVYGGPSPDAGADVAITVACAIPATNFSSPCEIKWPPNFDGLPCQ